MLALETRAGNRVTRYEAETLQELLALRAAIDQTAKLEAAPPPSANWSGPNQPAADSAGPAY